eukprot:109240_1
MAKVTTVGDIVLLTDGQVGIVRFIGEIKGETGVYYGIDLSHPNGNTDGSWYSVYYFTTNENFGIFIKKSEISKVIEENEYKLPRVTVGDIVGIKEVGCNAIIRFIGWTLFYPEVVWYGVQLEEPIGDNNGIIDDHKYFTCAPNYGLFVMCTHVQLKKKKVRKKSKRNLARKKKKGTKTIAKIKTARKMKKQISYEEFVETHTPKPRPTDASDENNLKHFHAQFYNQITLPFFRIYSEMSDQLDVEKNKNVIDWILKYCTSSASDPHKDCGVNVFSDKQCYYAVLYNHSW